MSFTQKLSTTGFVMSCLVAGIAMEFRSIPVRNSFEVRPTEIASRYHLRNRTPDFFSRSKTSTQRPTRT